MLNLRVFRSTLTANDKYPFRDCENFSSWIQMRLSLKPKTFPDPLFHFWNLQQILNIFLKNGEGQRYFIMEFTDSERVGYTTH